MDKIYKRIKLTWEYPKQPTSLGVGSVRIIRGREPFTVDTALSQTIVDYREYSPSFTEFIDTQDLEENVEYYYMIIIYGDIDNTISAATDLYSVIIEAPEIDPVEPEPDVPPQLNNPLILEVFHTPNAKLLLQSEIDGEVYIDWGDGNPVNATRVISGIPNLYVHISDMSSSPVVKSTDANWTQIKIYGNFLGMNGNSSQFIICGNSLRRVISWGDGMSLIKHIYFGPMSNFESNSLIEVPNELPGTITNFQLMFSKCTNLRCDLDQWNVSAATNFSGMFNGATMFNGNISTWVLKNVPALNVSDMFSNLPFFNQDLSHWDLSNVSKPTLFAYNSSKFTKNKHPRFKS